MLKKIRKSLTPLTLFVAIILTSGFIIRAWRINETLGFYYDQGRDALVIWDLIHKFELFLIGPTTGIAGIFRGPFYYYLIAPFYLIGGGDPLFPEVFLIVTSVAALYIAFYIGRKIGGNLAGLLTLLLATFSHEIIYASRWLSNPTPMLLISMMILFCVYKIYEGSRNTLIWVILSFLLGSSLFHFGSSGELFYFPAILVVLLLFSAKNKFTNVLPSKRTFIYSLSAFLLTILPLVVFDIIHNGILRNNISKFLFADQTFSGSGARFIYERFFQVLSYFYALLFHSPYEKEFLWLIALAALIIYNLSSLLKNEKFKILSIFLASPLIGLLFFRGNFGNIYGYYLTGYYLIFLIFIGTSLAHIFTKSLLGKIFVISFLSYFISNNWFWTKGLLNTKVTDETIIVLGTQKKAIDWVYENAGTNEFNFDVYVPPVIPHSYNYLFTWYGGGKYNRLPKEDQVKLLYTLYEIDPEHPDRLDAWIARQDGIGKLVKETRIGGVVVQERERIKYDN